MFIVAYRVYLVRAGPSRCPVPGSHQLPAPHTIFPSPADCQVVEAPPPDDFPLKVVPLEVVVADLGLLMYLDVVAGVEALCSGG